MADPALTGRQMADEMANSGLTDDLAARVGVLSQRVATTETAIVDLRKEMHTGFTTLANKFDERSKTPWPGIAVGWAVVAFVLTAIGTLVYYPLNNRVGSIEAQMVTREEIDWRSARGAEDRARNEAAIADLRGNVIPRAELDQRFENNSQDRATLQRQIDELRSNFGDSYSLRDALSELQQRLSRLEMMKLREAGAPPSTAF